MARPIRFAEVGVGDEIPSLPRIVVREDVRAYANASGDHNPLHQDDAIARAAGFPGIVAHGMFTMGHMGACVIAWAGERVPVTRISAQFRAVVLMGEEIVAAGRVRQIDPASRTVTVDLWVSVERDGVTQYPIKKGEAVVRFPE